MTVTGWAGGSPNVVSGGGYGIKLSLSDRDEHFRRSWQSVTILLDGGPEVQVAVSPSFWRRCSELRSQEIGRWMLDRGLAPWPEGRPPKLQLTPLGGSRFGLCR